MDEGVGYFGRYDQGIFVGMVHPVCICISEDDVSWLLLRAPYGVYTCSVHHDLGWAPRFLCVSITRVATIPILISPPELVKTSPLVGKLSARSLHLTGLHLWGGHFWLVGFRPLAA